MNEIRFLIVGVLTSLLFCVSAFPTAAQEDADSPPPKLDVNKLIQNSKVFTNSIGMELRKVSDGFWAGTYEVTHEQYQEIASGNPSAFSGENHPVDSVSWTDAMQFCERLTSHEKEKEMLPDGYAYTLPTQEQWERLAEGTSLNDAVTSSGTRRSGTAPVGSLSPNGLGLYDVRGNVLEWCLDPQDQSFRVLRGGSWQDFIEVNLRTEFRNYEPPDQKRNTFGFRCVLSK